MIIMNTLINSSYSIELGDFKIKIKKFWKMKKVKAPIFEFPEFLFYYFILIGF